MNRTDTRTATPSLEEVRAYWDAYPNDAEVARAQPGTPAFFEELERYRYEKIDYLRAYVGFERYAGKRVLEVGCGLGHDLVQFARAGAHVTGLDLSRRAVELARANLARAGRTGTVLRGDAEHLAFPDGTFDVVYSHGVLHHTPDTGGAIREAHRVLRTGGEAIVMLYHRRSWMFLASRIGRTPIEHPEREAPVVRGFTRAECRALFAPFRTVSIHVDRLPKPTEKHRSLRGRVFNRLVVPAFRALPDRATRPFGFHLMVRARK